MASKEIIVRPLEEREKEMVKVAGKYLIDTDPYGYNVRISGIDKPLAYFGKFESALSYIVEELKRNKLKADARTLEDAIGVIKASNDEVFNIIRYAFPEYEIVRK